MIFVLKHAGIKLRGTIFRMGTFMWIDRTRIAIMFLISLTTQEASGQSDLKISSIQNIADGTFSYPSFSPKKQTFYAQKKVGSFLQLFSIEKNNNPVQLTKDSADHSHPAVSSNGDWLAYTKEINGKRDIHLLHLSTLEDRNLTTTPAHSESHPSWAYKDSVIFFNTNSYDSLQEIASIRIDTKEVQRITHNNEEDTYPSLSPDGKQIVFTKWLENEKNAETYILNLSTSEEKRITNNALRDIAPVWLSDSVISYTQNGFIIIYDLYTGLPKRLVNDAGLQFVRGVSFERGLLLCERVNNRRAEGLSVIGHEF